MQRKPDHLSPEYGAQFEDPSVARAYSTRPPYPAEVFEVLAGLLPPGDEHRVLDLGCGTGDLALALVDHVSRVDAVDPSAAMLAAARARPGSEHAALRWIHAPAETAALHERYSLIVAGESFHWMDWQVVPARIAAVLHPSGFLALVVERAFVGLPWAGALAELIPKYSTNSKFRPYDLVAELTRRRRFREAGRRTTRGVPFAQPVEAYVESFHTRNGLSRDRMNSARAKAFDEALRLLVIPHCPDGIVRGKVCATVVWGAPLGDA